MQQTLKQKTIEYVIDNDRRWRIFMRIMIIIALILIVTILVCYPPTGKYIMQVWLAIQDHLPQITIKF